MVLHTWSERGNTPLLNVSGRRDHISCISAITPDGHLYTQKLLGEAFNTTTIIDFLHHLLRHAGRKLLIIWDGATIHRSKQLRQFLRVIGDRIRLERLPAYAPELNPDEWVWSHLKRDLGNIAARSLADLSHHLTNAINRLRRKPTMITSFVKQVVV